MRDLYSPVLVKSLVNAGVLGATSASTTAVDMKTCRDALLIINFVKGNDVPTSVSIEDSADNSTFATHTSIANASLAATALHVVELPNIKRYIRIVWTRSTANADSYWSVQAVGHNAMTKPQT